MKVEIFVLSTVLINTLLGRISEGLFESSLSTHTCIIFYSSNVFGKPQCKHNSRQRHVQVLKLFA